MVCWPSIVKTPSAQRTSTRSVRQANVYFTVTEWAGRAGGVVSDSQYPVHTTQRTFVCERNPLHSCVCFLHLDLNLKQTAVHVQSVQFV